MPDASSTTPSRWRETVVQRAQDTGDPSPTVTMVLGWVTVATVSLVPAIVVGSIPSVVAGFAMATMLFLLPNLFAPWHGRSAAVCRGASLVLLLVLVVAVGVSLWG